MGYNKLAYFYHFYYVFKLLQFRSQNIEGQKLRQQQKKLIKITLKLTSYNKQNMLTPLPLTIPQLIHTHSYKPSLEDLNGTQQLQQSPTLSRKSQQKLSVLQASKQKVQKRNQQLIRLFKPIKHQQFSLQILQKSPYMETNQIYNYLVNRLQKQRQGMINVDIKEQKRKAPKPIQNKIRQFLYHSLQQSLLMSDSQLRESKYFERLLEWFTDVFRQREMKLGFKLEGKENIDRDTGMDQDWVIRNTYKSNMPLELGQYQRKILNLNQVSDFTKQTIAHFEQSLNERQIQYQNDNTFTSLNRTQYGQNKIFHLSQSVSSAYSKSTQLLPVLKARSYLSKLSKIRQKKQTQELRSFQQHQKKSRAQFLQHSTKNYLETQKVRANKNGERQGEYRKTNENKDKQNPRQFSLNTKILEKIQAARLGVTCTQFRKNKSTISKQTETYNSPVFHPNLTGNCFNDIKKKRLQKIQKDSFPHLLKAKELNNTEQSEDLSRSNGELDSEELDQERIYNILFGEREDDELVESIDGMGLSMIVSEKKEKGKKKKNEEKQKQKEKDEKN